MLEFDTNTLAFMTAALEQSCKKLNDDSPDARKFIAERLKQCARTGRGSMAALSKAGDDAVAELNGSSGDSRGWRFWKWRQDRFSKPV